MMEIGQPLYWDLNKHIESIIQMIKADEIQIAIKMCDEIPAYYRENYPPELADIKRILHKNLYDQFEYSNDPDERGYTHEGVREQIKSGYMFPRLDVIDASLAQANSLGQTPWIFEISPSHGNLAVALTDNKRRFSFFGKNMNHLATERFRPWLDDNVWHPVPTDEQERWLVTFEVIEHCFNPDDVVRSAGKMQHVWDRIFLSVPNGCLGGGLPNWTSRRIGHVRGWTAKEFLDFASANWPGYSWTLYKSVSIVLVGEKIKDGQKL